MTYAVYGLVLLPLDFHAATSQGAKQYKIQAQVGCGVRVGTYCHLRSGLGVAVGVRGYGSG